jgi:hypothetical protein
MAVLQGFTGEFYAKSAFFCEGWIRSERGRTSSGLWGKFYGRATGGLKNLRFEAVLFIHPIELIKRFLSRIWWGEGERR